jgi:Trypsin-co-occurring domain 2
MNLSEFVEETLSEILAGIRAAQAKNGGDYISAEMYGDASAQGIFNGGTSGHFTVVQFDVSVAAQTNASGKGGLQVWSVGVEGGGEHATHHTNRVQFSVHMKLPEGRKVPQSQSFNREITYPDARLNR